MESKAPEEGEWHSVDTHGRRLAIDGLGGWGFESLRACYRSLREGGFIVWRMRQLAVVMVGANLGSQIAGPRH